MAIGIEHFRNIATTGANRVAIGGAGHDQVVQAPLSFAGKVVAWRSPVHATSMAQAHENIDARTTFYNALVRSYGQQTADQVMNSRFGSPLAFRQDSNRLSSSTIKQVLTEADRLTMRDMRTNRQAAANFISGGHLTARFAATVGQPVGVGAGLGVPAQFATDPEFQAAFRRAVVRHPDYGKAPLSGATLRQLADDTAQSFFQAKADRFQRTYPGLATVTNPPFGDRRTFIDTMQRKLNSGLPDPTPHPGSPLRQEPAQFRSLASSTLTQIDRTADLVKAQPFAVQDVANHAASLMSAWHRLDNLEIQLTGVAAGGLGADGQNLRTALLNEIAAQKQTIMDKVTFCQEYLQHDPLSRKQAAYDKLIWAQSAAVMIDAEIQRLALGPADPVRLQLEGLRDQIVNQATNAHQTAPTNQRVTQGQMKTLLQQHKSSTKNDIAQAFRTAAQNPTASPALVRALDQAARNVGDGMKAARLTAMNTTQAWTPLHRTMVVTKDGESRSYTSSIIPASQSGGRVARQMGALHGVSAGTKDDPTNARNLQVSQLTNSTGLVVHKSIRHGVLDPWALRRTSGRGPPTPRPIRSFIWQSSRRRAFATRC